MNKIGAFFVWIWRWFWEHIYKIGELKGRKEAIAGGVAIGVLIGFTPLFGIKTVLAMLLAWMFRCNVVAAAISVSLHDISWPLLPVLMLLEYDVGYWLLNSHHFPPSGHHILTSHSAHQLLQLQFWQTTGLPVLLGSLVFGVVGAPLSYFFTLSCLHGLEKKRLAREAAEAQRHPLDEAEAEDLHHRREPSEPPG
ncbi:DUF2062 domain-containing protein [Verrucomicrobia bacterium LW23]|nr:DUF2062 domain-containing protein [Verrucomicrobia bacterium LW23]